MDIPFRKIVELNKAVTGWRTSLFDLIKVGERTNIMARCFNVREGFTPSDDNLPVRFFKPLGNGALKGKV